MEKELKFYKGLAIVNGIIAIIIFIIVFVFPEDTDLYKLGFKAGVESVSQSVYSNGKEQLK